MRRVRVDGVSGQRKITMSNSIRESPYEVGLYFVDPEPGTTLQSIGSQQWQVRGLSFGNERPLVWPLAVSSMKYL